MLMKKRRRKKESKHSGNSISHGSSDGLKLLFLMFKALKTKVANFSMVGAFVIIRKI